MPLNTTIKQHLMLYPIIPPQFRGNFQDIVSMKCAENNEIAKQNYEKVQ